VVPSSRRRRSGSEIFKAPNETPIEEAEERGRHSKHGISCLIDIYVHESANC
jgi:hypothetical protein